MRKPLSEQYNERERSLDESCNRAIAELQKTSEKIQEIWTGPFQTVYHLARVKIDEILEEFPSPEDHTEMLEIIAGIWAWTDPNSALGGLEWLHHAIRDRKKRAKHEESQS
jgi:hypothetical protein